MACLGVRETQKAAGSQILLLPGRGCSGQPKLSRGRRQSGWVALWDRKPEHPSQKEFAKVRGQVSGRS